MNKHDLNTTSAHDVPKAILERFFDRLKNSGVSSDIVNRLKKVFQSEDGVREMSIKDALLKTD